jgi:hypothetical protein
MSPYCVFGATPELRAAVTVIVPDVNAEHLALTAENPATFATQTPGAVAVVV